MLSHDDVLFANEQQVAAKVMDGEAILINLATGAYYSIGSTGGFIWSLIERRLSVEEIVRAVTEQYEVDRSRALSDVLRLGNELRAEGLVVVSPTGAITGIAPQSSGTRLGYEAPELQKFTDMAEMFALDPPLPGLSYTETGKQDTDA